MTTKAGDINGYICETCTGVIYVRHADAGTTPMFLTCRATAGCAGRMDSTMYALPPAGFHPLHVTYEWFKPNDLSDYDPSMRDHLERGGLDLRRIPCTVNNDRCAHPPLEEQAP